MLHLINMIVASLGPNSEFVNKIVLCDTIKSKLNISVLFKYLSFFKLGVLILMIMVI